MFVCKNLNGHNCRFDNNNNQEPPMSPTLNNPQPNLVIVKHSCCFRLRKWLKENLRSILLQLCSFAFAFTLIDFCSRFIDDTIVLDKIDEFNKAYNSYLYDDYTTMKEVTKRFDQHIVDMIMFVLFFVLFPRDQSFYVLLVIASSLYMNTFVKIFYHEPHLYVINHDIKAPFCSHVSGLAFSFPSYPCMLQVCFDFSMYLIVFHTG